MVITGDVTQVDLPANTGSGLRVVRSIVHDIAGVDFVELTSKDVVSHRIVQAIVDAYARYDESVSIGVPMIWLRRHPSLGQYSDCRRHGPPVLGVLVIGTGDRFGRLAVGTPSPATSTPPRPSPWSTGGHRGADPGGAARREQRLRGDPRGSTPRSPTGSPHCSRRRAMESGRRRCRRSRPQQVAPAVTSTTVPATTATRSAVRAVKTPGHRGPSDNQHRRSRHRRAERALLDLDGNGVRERTMSRWLRSGSWSPVATAGRRWSRPTSTAPSPSPR